MQSRGVAQAIVGLQPVDAHTKSMAAWLRLEEGDHRRACQRALGGWHGESVATLGKFLAGTMVGAKTGKSIEAYERAIALDGSNPSFRTFYAITLIGIGNTEPKKLRRLLTPAANGRSGNGFDHLMRARARALLAALDGGKSGALEAAAEQARAFAGIG